MSPQIYCMNGYKVTLVAFVIFFSAMGFQMRPQFAWISALAWPLLGHLHLLSSKETVLGMDKFQTSLMEQFGDIVRLQVLGSLICNVYQSILIGSALKLIFE